MNYNDINEIENGLKAMLEDEEKGIVEYEKKIQEASRLGAVTTAMELQKIKQQESAHADTLRVLIGRAEFAKFGIMPGHETGVVMEARGNARVVRPPLKEMPKVSQTKAVPKIKFRKFWHDAIEDTKSATDKGASPPLRLRTGAVRESRYSGVQRRTRY